MVQVLAFQIRFQLSHRCRFPFSLVITVDVAQKCCCSGRMKAYGVSWMFQGMWIKSVSMFCNVQLMQVRFPLKIELLF